MKSCEQSKFGKYKKQTGESKPPEGKKCECEKAQVYDWLTSDFVKTWTPVVSLLIAILAFMKS